MPCISGLLTNKLEALINVSVTSVVVGHNKPTFYNFTALLDTGANRTCINKDVISKLSLDPLGKVNMCSASHNVVVNSYIVDLMLPFGTINVGQSGVTVLEFNASNDFQIIIGMDIISNGLLSISHDKRFIFCL